MHEKIPSTPPRRTKRWIMAALAVILVACADPQESPARDAIAKIDAALAATGTDPARYIPGELKAAQARVETLKDAYARQEFSTVLEQAPDVLAQVTALGPAATAKARQLEAMLEQEWTDLAASLPGELAALQSAIGATGHHGAPGGLPAEQSAGVRKLAADAQALWNRALQEHAGGRLPEAVTLASQAREITRRAASQPRLGAGQGPVE